MMTQNDIKLRRITGISGIICGLFIPAVVIQLPLTGWFPETALEANSMEQWVAAISTKRSLILIGIGLSIIAVVSFLMFGMTFYRLLPKESTSGIAGICFNISGSILALIAFTFAFGFTWAIIDLSAQTKETITPLATMGMRGFLAGDDLATLMIGTANIFLAISARNAGILPKWLVILAITGASFSGIVLFRYFIPELAVFAIGYPLIIIWFVFTGIHILSKTRKTQ